MDDLEFTEPARLASPCVNYCTLDLASGWCIGCGRSGDEIAAWPEADDARRQAILDMLPARMATLRR